MAVGPPRVKKVYDKGMDALLGVGVSKKIKLSVEGNRSVTRVQGVIN